MKPKMHKKHQSLQLCYPNLTCVNSMVWKKLRFCFKYKQLLEMIQPKYMLCNRSPRWIISKRNWLSTYYIFTKNFEQCDIYFQARHFIKPTVVHIKHLNHISTTYPLPQGRAALVTAIDAIEQMVVLVSGVIIMVYLSIFNLEYIYVLVYHDVVV